MKWHDAIDEPEKGGNYIVCCNSCNEPFIATYHKAFKKWMTHRTKDGRHSMWEMPSECTIQITHWIPLPIIPELKEVSNG